MTIREEIERFDGKRPELLECVLSKRRSAKSTLNELVMLITDKESKVQIRATWLLKRFAEDMIQFQLRPAQRRSCRWSCEIDKLKFIGHKLAQLLIRSPNPTMCPTSAL